MRQPSNKSHLYLRIVASMFMMAAVWPLNSMAKTDFQIARQLIEKGQIPEARRALSSELRIHPRNIEARYDLAVLLEDIGHHGDAKALYEKNLRLSWHLPSLINLAVMLARQDKTAQSRQWLEKATKKLRFEAAPWYLLAAMSEKSGHIREAASQYRKATKADPLNGFAWLRFADFQSRRKLADRGVKYAEKALRLLPDCAPCWYHYANIMQTADHKHKALAAYQRSLAISPDSKTRQQLIDILRRLGQNKRANHMQQALDARYRYHAKP